MSEPKECDRKKSFTTPCVITDGDMCYADDGHCVGCGRTKAELTPVVAVERDDIFTPDFAGEDKAPAHTAGQISEEAIERMNASSQYYSEPRLYNFGFYDGYRFLSKRLEEAEKEIARLREERQENESLRATGKELAERLKIVRNKIESWSDIAYKEGSSLMNSLECEIDPIAILLTRYESSISKPEQ